MFLARLNGEGGKIFVEDDAATVALNLAQIDDGEDLKLEYWNVNENGGAVTLQKVTLKAGARSSAPLQEVVEIEAGGADVGSAKRDA